MSTLAAAAVLAGLPVQAGANVRISQQEGMVHLHPYLAAAPNDADRLIACSWLRSPSDVNNADSAAIYGSIDGGKTWTLLQRDSRWGAAEQSCTYGGNGTIYFLVSAPTKPQPLRTRFTRTPVFSTEPLHGPMALNIHRSTDGGRTWALTALPGVGNNTGFAVDGTAGKYRGRVYLAYSWPEGGSGEYGVALAASTDGGATFGKPVVYPVGRDAYWITGAGILSDGTVIVVCAGDPGRALRIFTSPDGGSTIQPLPVAGSPVPAAGVPVIDTGSGPFKDRIYLAWNSMSRDLKERDQIYFAYSADKGKTWSAPRILNDDRAWPPRADGSRGPDHYNPHIAVNKDGIVGIQWYDGRDIPPGPDAITNKYSFFVRFRASLDGGETWTPSVRISEQPRILDFNQPYWFHIFSTPADAATGSPLSIDINLNPKPSTSMNYGLTADATGVFHSAWVDNRTGFLQLWTAPVAVSGKAWRNGTPELARMRDVSPKVFAEVVAVTENKARRTVTAAVRLNNDSPEPIRGPIKLRLLRLGSDRASVSAVNADNGLTGEGAVWDFTAALPSGALLPGKATQLRELIFEVADPRGFANGFLASLDARVLAGPE